MHNPLLKFALFGPNAFMRILVSQATGRYMFLCCLSHSYERSEMPHGTSSNLAQNIHLDLRMKLFDFGGQRSKVKGYFDFTSIPFS